MKTNRGYTLVELLVTIALIAIVISFISMALGGCTRSDGARVGTIVKFSRKGNIVKSYEGEMVLGGSRSASSGDGSVSLVANIWEFTVVDPKVAEQIESLQDSGHRAKAYYRQTMVHNPFTRDTSYTVYKIVDIDAAAGSIQLEK